MSMRSFRLWVAVVAALALLASACGSDEADSTTETTLADSTASESGGDESTEEETPAEESTEEETADDEATADEGDVLRVAIVAPSASNDLAFTQSMVDAVNIIGESRAIEVDITDNTFVIEDAAAAIRGYADDGFDLVIAHGSQYGAPLAEIAPDFPEVSFAWGTAADTFDLPNVFAYTVRADEGGYVLGTIAAQLSESKVIGVIGPVEVGDAKLYIDGFVNGVAAQDSSIETRVNYIDSFSDVLLAAEAATAHLTNDADVLTGSAQMVVGATGVAREEGVPWFGTQANQTSLGEDIVVASQVYHWEVILEEMMTLVDAGTLGGEVFTLTFANAGLVIEFNDGFGLDGAVQTAAEATAADIAAGTIETGAS